MFSVCMYHSYICIDLYTHSLLLSSIPLENEEASRGMCHSVVFTVTVDIHV